MAQILKTVSKIQINITKLQGGAPIGEDGKKSGESERRQEET